MRSPVRTNSQRSWQSSTKRQILGLASNSNNNFDGSNHGQVASLIQDLQAKCDSLRQILKTELYQHKNLQEETLSTGLVKLPKSIKQMTVKEFNESHHCDILALLKAHDGVIPKKVNQKKRDYTSAVAETPAYRPRNPGTNTIVRTAAKGEGI
jgi:hypothetical protein